MRCQTSYVTASSSLSFMFNVYSTVIEVKAFFSSPPLYTGGGGSSASTTFICQPGWIPEGRQPIKVGNEIFNSFCTQTILSFLNIFIKAFS